MQALAERLDQQLGGSQLVRIVEFAASARKSIHPAPSEVEGADVHSVRRRGKYLLVNLSASAGMKQLVIHLGQSGRIDVEVPPRKTHPKTARFRMHFEARGHQPGAELVECSLFGREYGREHRMAWWILGEGDEGPLAVLGPDADTEAAEALIRSSQDRKRIHGWLRDQRVIAGLGRGHTDDLLWMAGISPIAMLSALGMPERDRIVSAIGTVLEGALERERTRVGGLSDARLGDRFLVHGRYGQMCLRCAEPFRRVAFTSYEITYCATCQTGGRALADRRRSRILK